MEWRLIQGDLATVKADALVNAAGTSLNMGGGVAGALRRRGGEHLAKEALSKAPVKLGDAVETGAYKLDARYVIHAAAQPHYGNYKATKESVREATRNALRLADQLGCKSIALPAIGCGIAGCQIKEGAAAIVSELEAYNARNLESALVVAYSAGDYGEFRKHLEK